MKTPANPWKSVSLVLAGILIGCGAGAATTAVAQFPPNPAAPKWQQQCIDVHANVPRANQIDPIVSRLGAEGWELVGVSYAKDFLALLCFKRPAPGGAPAPEPTAAATQ